MKLNSGTKFKLKRAEQAFDNSDFKLARKILKPLIASRNPAAIFLDACYSEAKESETAFERRHFKSVEKAANLGWPSAVYQLGMYLDTGDFGEYDPKRASELFKEAAHLDHPRSQWIYAIELLWGKGNFEQNINEGMKWLRKSIDNNFHEALETMALIYEKGELGIEKNQELANEYRQSSEIAYDNYLKSDEF